MLLVDPEVLEEAWFLRVNAYSEYKKMTTISSFDFNSQNGLD